MTSRTPADKPTRQDSTVDSLVALAPWLTVVAAITGAFYTIVLLVWDDAPFAFTFDDAYYYFGIARNLAEGAGSTFDGINPTNGYHPLWLMVAVPVYLFGLDGIDAVRALLLVQIAAYTAAAIVIAQSVSRLVSATAVGRGGKVDGPIPRPVAIAVTTTFALVVANPFVVKIFVNGLESGISVLLYAAVLARLGSVRGTLVTTGDQRWRSLTGILLLLVLLARTDAVVMLGCLGLWCLAEVAVVIPRSARRQALGAMVDLFGPAAIGLVVYLTANQARFGTAMQVSGELKRADLTAVRLVAIVVVLAIAAAVGRRAWHKMHHRTGDARTTSNLPRCAQTMDALGWYLSFCIMLVGYYTVVSTQVWLWYFAPLGVLIMLVVPIFAADLVDSALRQARRGERTTRVIVPAAAIIIAPLLIAAAIQVPRFVDPDLRSIQIANRDAGMWIAANLDDDAVLASWDAGVVGYFAERPVINVDGVANSPEFADALRSGRVGPFLDAQDLGYLVNHGVDVDGNDPAAQRAIARWWSPEVAESAVVVETWPFRFSGVSMGSEGTSSNDAQARAVFLYQLPPVDNRR